VRICLHPGLPGHGGARALFDASGPTIPPILTTVKTPDQCAEAG